MPGRSRAAAARWLGPTLVAGLLGGCQSPPAEPSATPPGPPTFAGAPVILVSIDTLRADHLPAYGYDGVETPSIDRIAADAVLFENAYSQAPLTLPSHLTAFTGLMPYEHGVRNNIGFELVDGVSTLAMSLRAQGYATGAAVSSYVLRRSTGADAGFDDYDDGILWHAGKALGQLSRDGESTWEAARAWLESRPRDRAFLLFLHLFEPHAPYQPPPDLADRYASAYDGEIAAADAIVGRVLRWLDDRDLYDDSLLVLFSDHGEGLGDHGEQEHGIFLYREALHVPVLLKLPGSLHAGTRVETAVRLAELRATVERLVTGRSAGSAPDWLQTALAGQAPAEIYAETLYPRIHLGWSPLRSLIAPPWHFIEAPRSELYAIGSDPGETHDVVAAERRVLRRLQQALAAYPDLDGAEAEIDPQEQARLEALGYLGSGGSSAGGPLADPKDRIQDLEALRAAFADTAAGRLDQAAERLHRLLEANPGMQDAWNKLAEVEERRGDFDAAIAAQQSALRRQPGLLEERALSLAELYLRLGRLGEARQHAELAASSTPNRATLVLARCALQDGAPGEARRLALPLREDPESFFAATVLVAETLLIEDRPAAALELADEASQRAADFGQPVAALSLVRADALARLQRYDESRTAFEAEISAFPERREAYTRLAVMETVRGDRAAAREALRRMVEANPGDYSRRLAARTAATLGDREAAAAWRATDA